MIMVSRASGIEPELPPALTPRFYAGAHDDESWCVADDERQGSGGGRSSSTPSGVRKVTPASSSNETTE